MPETEIKKNGLSATLKKGDCLREMDMMILDGEQVDSIVCDPPYHLVSVVKRFGKEGSAPAKRGTDGLFQRQSKGFLGLAWDGGDIAFDPETWRRAYDLLKPGGYLVAFAAPKNVHRMTTAIEEAGFEIRDRVRYECALETKYAPLMDSLNEAQQDALIGLLEDVCGPGELAWEFGSGMPKSHNVGLGIDKLNGAPNRGSAISVANRNHPTTGMPRKNGEYLTKYSGRTEQAKKYEGFGTALKPAYEPIVVARKPLSESSVARNVLEHGTGGLNVDACRVGRDKDDVSGWPKTGSRYSENTCMSGPNYAREPKPDSEGRWPANVAHDGSPLPYPDNADRFFYCAKASKKDRSGSKHPTVKPIKLMMWLVRLVTPPGGTVLDPFMGSGSTLQAALEEGFSCVGIEREEEYYADAVRRVEDITRKGDNEE